MSKNVRFQFIRICMYAYEIKHNMSELLSDINELCIYEDRSYCYTNVCMALS